MPEHVLVKYAKRRPYQVTPRVPEGARYDPVRGYWLRSGSPLVTAEEFAQGGPVTKKCDQETGEDQKGE
jgi:hypothetical protein